MEARVVNALAKELRRIKRAVADCADRIEEFDEKLADLAAERAEKKVEKKVEEPRKKKGGFQLFDEAEDE